ncbi:thiol peroxidase [Peptoanaerobacter stomatis]
MEKRTVTMAGNPVTLLGKEAKVGEKAENFNLTKQDLSNYNFDESKGKIRIISVVPSIDTGVCELQTIDFNQRASQLKDVEIITISLDLPFAQSRFCAAKGIDNIVVASDYKDREFGLKYGFLIDELKLLARGIVVVDRDDTIRYVEYVSEVTNHVDYDRAIEEAKKLI